MVATKLLKRGLLSYERMYALSNKENVSVVTPAISVSKTIVQKINDDHQTNENFLVEVLYEIRGKSYRSLLNSINTPTLEYQVNRKLKPLEGKINIFIVAWTSWKENAPTPDLFYSISSRILNSLNYEKVVNDNFVVPPFSYLINNCESFDAAWKFMQDYHFPLLNSIEETIKRPENVFGYVPIYFFSGEHLKKLLWYYWNAGLNKMIIDFGGKHIETLKDRVFTLIEFKEIIESEFGEKTPLIYYAFNTFRGQFRKSRNEIPARDFLSLFVGFDILGSFSRRGMKLDNKNNSDSELFEPKEFIREKYTYVKSSLSDKLVKIQNAVRKVEETSVMHSVLKSDETLEMLLKSKPEDVHKIVNKIRLQTKLPDLLE